MGYINLHETDGSIRLEYVRMSDNEIKKVEKTINNLVNSLTGKESEDRLIIQNFLDRTNFNYDILYNGNGVYGYIKTIKNFKTYLKTGKLSDYLYRYFNLHLGTIAHFNKEGWRSNYPDAKSLKELFEENEYGEKVVDYIPKWSTDNLLIVKEMQKILDKY
jgi:hypothetical protein